MASPTLTGVHHVKFPVTDIEATAAFFEKALGAKRVKRFNHKDEKGELFAAMMHFPGCDFPVELRHAPKAAKAVAGYDPVTFGISDKSQLDLWAAQLDSAGVKHSGVVTGYIGHLIDFETPDGLAIRFYTNPKGGFENVVFDTKAADIHNPQVNKPLMQS